MRTQAEIEKEMAPLQKRLSALQRELSARIDHDRNDEMARLFPDGVVSLKPIMDLAYDRLKQPWYDRVHAYLAKEREPGGSLRGTYTSGYNPDTNQIHFKVMLDQNEPLASQGGIKTALPLIQPHAGWKTIGIFEHTLSEYAVWFLMVSEDGSRFLVLNHRRRNDLLAGRDPAPSLRGRGSDFAEFKDVDSALAYIYMNHPYCLASDED